jgi:hypothetical protein
MDGITEVLQRTVEQLLGRSSGPLHFRLILQPIIASTIAIKAGLKDARQGQPPFLWALFTRAAERKRLMRSGWKDIGKVFIIALLMDTAYQLFEFPRVLSTSNFHCGNGRCRCAVCRRARGRYSPGAADVSTVSFSITRSLIGQASFGVRPLNPLIRYAN